MVTQNISQLGHPAQAKVWQLLGAIPDPEIPVITIAELGMLRKVDYRGNEWVVTFTPTYSGCPATEMLIADIRQTMESHGYLPVRIEIRLDPAWTTDWLTPEARNKLTRYGIAPPQGQACMTRSLPDEVPCPHCSSTQTRLISEFGSTACKAHYQCRDCLEPFDYFKCI
ncbi:MULTISPECIES: 1,2-phenylacetyl-CoA epoxidase subunit PaaD [Photobacterium]|uniref:Phenylacetic acid degradation protein n=1 Tax=Photobacterium ganghwense TaxID=320778 RepID=A0A0J1HE07_9GAMM|nr:MULTISPECIES: 1,2-phenylacetyl-CoA epoxidase subunit PaaD [Photobacterium]KLV09856.1 phenylacetic acid degradation protein [Photobacterium ganghwense]MBV1839577.1 phenylacetate-CoA oxygenase subunit PaaJ [Photobacterium ganghwense]PSU09301.1 phenylacetate-CoA oxygenase subunit PaaJ [Photobacterium ganghwense]QSV16489.1 phenylacetate-CoA oxygenase subunit PaaJ [Photobacterium ganghwense]